MCMWALSHRRYRRLPQQCGAAADLDGMSSTRRPVVTALWHAQAGGAALHVQAHPADVLPPVAGRTLQDWLGAAHADDGADVLDELAPALAAGAPFQLEVSIRCTDGLPRRIVVSGLPSAAGSGHQGALIDITEQRRALEAAMRAAAEYRLLIEHSTDLIAHCDQEGRYVSISPSYGSMIGWRQHEVVGRRVIDFLHPDDQAPACDALARLFSGADLPDVVEVRKRHRSGHYVTVGTKARAVTDDTGQCIGAVLVSRDITQDKERLRLLEALATRDTLTGLPNRAWITDHVRHLLTQPQHGELTTVLFLDLNGFKAVNDEMGHAAGDELLRQVAQRLQAGMRPGDAVARLGGDEFIVAATCSSPATASAIASRLLASLDQPFALHDRTVRIGAAIGVAIDRLGSLSCDELLAQADVAMYQAKAQGRGVVTAVA